MRNTSTASASPFFPEMHLFSSIYREKAFEAAKAMPSPPTSDKPGARKREGTLQLRQGRDYLGLPPSTGLQTDRWIPPKIQAAFSRHRDNKCVKRYLHAHTHRPLRLTSSLMATHQTHRPSAWLGERNKTPSPCSGRTQLQVITTCSIINFLQWL